MKLIAIGPFSTNCYIIPGTFTIVIDPGWPDAEVEEVLSELEGTSPGPITMLVTHGHGDHWSGAESLVRKFPGSTLWISEGDRDFLKNNWSNCDAPKVNYFLSDIVPVRTFNPGDVITNGRAALRVVAAPGHTRGSVIFVEEERRTLFTGDTLFMAGFAHPDCPTGDAQQVRSSVHLIAKYPRDYAVRPGHGPGTMIAAEDAFLADRIGRAGARFEAAR